MSTLDVVAYAGESQGGVRPANFLDIGGGASAEVMANGLDVILADRRSSACSSTSSAASPPATRSRTASWRCRARELGERVDKPLVVRLDGNNVDEGRRILTERRTRWSIRPTRWTARRNGPPSSRTVERRE